MRLHGGGIPQRGSLLNPLELAQALRYPNSTVFLESFKRGFKHTTWGAGYDLLTTPDIDASRFLSKDEWEHDYSRPNLEWHKHMTVVEAEVDAERSDQEFRHNLITRNADRESSGWWAGAFGTMFPQVLDPVNYLPFAGALTKAARLGFKFNVSAKAAYATEFGLIESGRQGLFLARDRAAGQDFDTQSAILSIGLGLGIGTGFGALLDLHRAIPFRTRVRSLGIAWNDLVSGGREIPDLTVLRDTHPVMQPSGPRQAQDPSIINAPIKRPQSTDEFDGSTFQDQESYVASIDQSPADLERYAALASLRTRVIQTVKQCLFRSKGRT